MSPTTQRAINARLRLVTATQDIDKATVKRDRAIRDLRAAGVSLRAIAEAAGLSHTQIANIVRR